MSAFISAISLARTIYLLGTSPLGARRVQELYCAGLPEHLRPAFDWLFARKISPEARGVVERIETLRSNFAASPRVFHYTLGENTPVTRTSARLAAVSSVTPEWGTFLYLIASGIRAQAILELGSCVGISGAYLASAATCRQFISIEKSDTLAPVAQAHIHQVMPAAIVLNAAFDDALAGVLEQYETGIDLYYVDGNHQYAPTLRYFDQAIPRLKPGSVVILDDIHWSRGMWLAWQVLSAHAGLSWALDVGRFGLCVWQGGNVQPMTYNLAKYTGWLWDYAPSGVNNREYNVTG